MNKHDKLSIKEKSKKVTAATLIGLGAFGLMGCQNSSAEVPKQQQTTTTAPETSEPAQEIEYTAEGVERTAKSVEIESGLEADELLKHSLEAIESWRYAAATAEEIENTNQRSYKSDLDYDSFLDMISEENADIYADVLFPENWQSDANLVTIKETLTERNRHAIQAAFTNYLSNDKDPNSVAYSEISAVSVLSDETTGDTRSVTGDMSSGIYTPNKIISEETFRYTITVDESGPTAKILDFSY